MSNLFSKLKSLIWPQSEEDEEEDEEGEEEGLKECYEVRVDYQTDFSQLITEYLDEEFGSEMPFWRMPPRTDKVENIKIFFVRRNDRIDDDFCYSRLRQVMRERGWRFATLAEFVSLLTQHRIPETPIKVLGTEVDGGNPVFGVTGKKIIPSDRYLLDLFYYHIALVK